MIRLNIFVIGFVLAFAFNFVSTTTVYDIDIGEHHESSLWMGSDADIVNWADPRDFKYITDLPNTGSGSIITSVHMLIATTGLERPKAVVVSGGIGHAHMRISIQVKNTTTFNYRADVYGLNF